MVQRDFLVDVDAQRTLGVAQGNRAPADPVTPRLASTVMLLRDDEGPLEVFMLRRVAQMEFAASMHVFPGGGADQRDAEDELPWAGPAVEEWAELLGTDEASARMLVAAAVREVFEETGVLLASPVEAEDGPPQLDLDDARELRRALVAREVGFGQVLLERQLVLRSDLLRYRAHWITPVIESRRYDTRFFVAAVPAGQDPDGDTSEADQSGWTRPQALLDAFADGQVMLMPPTIVCLEQLAEVSTVRAGLEQDLAIAPVLPEFVISDAGPAVRASLP
ncbi:NUDIX hydrolase [Janibacter cremeus]|uniref:8-oxo-dGTP pyrophosphatase MutT (NUDIX family) n=1 Tax=Janibacter cremeus TaxID=1285192 RepID=A0A852VRZ9_9MICO|nr:NUDIX hydrolase [Janibacter cremeus]NYF98719.1 8-oxo-dGTP pyrophosphatase MutT (NUDIX family) [Janibacter cremeus]